MGQTSTLLSFANALDKRWNYLRSEKDRTILCGSAKVFYLNPGAGPRFGNAFLSRESGMGRICNIYRNNKLLELQAEPRIRKVFHYFYERMMLDMIRSEETAQYEKARTIETDSSKLPDPFGLEAKLEANPEGSLGIIQNLYLIPERLRVKSKYGQPDSETGKPWHNSYSHMMPPHADKHLVVHMLKQPQK